MELEHKSLIQLHLFARSDLILCVFTIHLQATSSLKQTNTQTQTEKRKEDFNKTSLQILQSDSLFLVSPDFVAVFPVGQ